MRSFGSTLRLGLIGELGLDFRDKRHVFTTGTGIHLRLHVLIKNDLNGGHDDDGEEFASALVVVVPKAMGREI
jgi:hypothetical protein